MMERLDLIDAIPWTRRTPRVAHLRRSIAALSLILPVALVSVSAARSAPAPPPGRMVAVGVASPVGIAPSTLFERAASTPWKLLELTLRPDAHGWALLAARFEAPHGAPAVPERLIASLSHAALHGLETTAIVATPRGTAVEVRARVALDVAARPGRPVPPERLAGGVAEILQRSGGRVGAIRRVGPEGDALSVRLDATAAVVAAALRDLEDGPSSPARLTSLNVRDLGPEVAVEIQFTARTEPDLR